jgi:hypothetical protein
LVLQGKPWQIRVDEHGCLHLEEVPVLHQILDGQAHGKALAQHIVDLDDLLQ